MGRHRNDPRGVGQIMAIATAIVLLVILIALGGYFLYRSLPGNGNLVTPNDTSAAASPGADTSTTATLRIHATKGSSEILVRIPGGEVLTDTVLEEGQYAVYEEPRLEVTVGDPSAVEAYVGGDPVDLSEKSADHSFSVDTGG